MRGEISFLKSLRSRLKLFSASQADIEKIAQKMKENISDSFSANKEFFKENKQQIFIVSGGFKEYILPATNELGISEENVFANEFVLDKQGKIIGINENNFLAKTQGKVKQVEALNLKGMVFAVGDGWTDYEIKREDEADYFLAYTENVSRKNVVDLANKVVKNFGEMI
jgi:D-3-phosphoglycerate dehydrogenase